MPTQARHKLTVAKINSLLRKGGPKTASDGAGLTLTISASGYASWILRYRFEGKRKEITIGSFDDFPLSDARDAAEELRRKVGASVDPAREKMASKAVQEAGGMPTTIKELSKLWYKRKIANSMKHPNKVKRVLENWVYPKLGKLHPEDVTPAHVVDCIEHIISSGAPTVANDSRRHIKAILNYGAILGCVTSNAAANIGQSDAGHKEQARTRYLTLGEISKLFKTMEKNRGWFGRDNELSIRLLLMLGVRKMELTAARWDEIDIDAGLWTIPPEHSKTDGFTVPLPPLAVEFLREIQIRACGSDWVFPSRRRGSRKLGHISADTINAALKSLAHGIDHFTVHDLRRTMRTQLSALGVRFEVAERCLNHSLKGIAGVYDRHDFLDSRRDALQRWSDVLLELDNKGVKAAQQTISSQKVVHLQATG